jgi:hypothetical protein
VLGSMVGGQRTYKQGSANVGGHPGSRAVRA